MLRYYPFRYEDRSEYFTIAALTPSITDHIQLQGYIGNIKEVKKNKKKLVAYFEDGTGRLELIWFQGYSWVTKINCNQLYYVWGKPIYHLSSCPQIVHPEIIAVTSKSEYASTHWLPLYHSTEQLKRKKLDTKGLLSLQKALLSRLHGCIPETLPTYLLNRYRLPSLEEALQWIHFPADKNRLEQARRRLKFEELFYLQLKLFKLKQIHIEKQPSRPFCNLSLLKIFYPCYLPFCLTGDQKKAIKGICCDLSSGKQMNRLLQGDVGSGKTIVAFLAMLVVIGSQAQVAIMAPTEVLAKQHYDRFYLFTQQLNLHIVLLTGSTKKKERENILYQLKVGLVDIVVGTHALLEEGVAFKELGLFIIDEQHRFGVAQRAKLLAKNQSYIPHMLIMSATPIPRTLAMAFYGDLDISTIYELPVGRKPVKTFHFYETARPKAFQLLRRELQLGRQAYIVYPLIEVSEILDYSSLLSGYKSVVEFFPNVSVGMIHGRMDNEVRNIELERFRKGEVSILVATTVIEVGIHVSNATVIVIESAERFGLSQLHQLRGRVGRGIEQSYCILITSPRLSKIGRKRIDTMVKLNDGFEIAELDLKLRGPGDLMGLRQSGGVCLKIADLSVDTTILAEASRSARFIVSRDPDFQHPSNLPIKQEYTRQCLAVGDWGVVS